MMLSKGFKFYTVTAAFAISAAVASSVSMAALISASVGGVPVGADVYENFDSLAGTGGLSAQGLSVTFSGTGAGAVTLPDAPGLYAAPFISGSNGAQFGDLQVNGPDQTQYLTTGIGQVTIQLAEGHEYFGLLWGSVDNYNSLSFYSGDTLLFSFTGLDVDVMANGDQGANGTRYVNIFSDTLFDRVVASSTAYAFEFDNVALAIHLPPAEIQIGVVPEPGTLALLGLGLLAGIVTRHRRTA
jgi:hypothetical protein